jgi:O-antigen/teichoic acid export membrane protein
MTEVKSEPQTSSTHGDAHKASFFRQSGWLMIANIAGGVLMWAVHLCSNRIPKGEYGIFIAFLTIVMCIPTMPLQMALAHQTAQAIARNRLRQLTGMIRAITGITFMVWVLAGGAIFLCQGKIVKHWGIANPAGIYVTLAVVLLSVWLPIFWGVLQGQQSFMWLGWSMISNGIGRLAVAAFAVLMLGAYAAGMMTGVLAGMVVATGIAIWQTRGFWRGSSLPFDWREVLWEIVPPMLGFGAFQFLFSGDTLFVKAYFSNDTAGVYGSAGTLSRALMWLVGPLASVMFPRIVHSAAKSEKSNLMNLVLAGTAILAIVGAAGLSLLGPLVVRVVYPADYVGEASAMLPWYAGAMVPLTIANVLLNNLLARSAFKVVAPICALAIAYGFALTHFNDSPVTVLKTMGLFNVVLALVCAWFTWTGSNKAKVTT